MKHFEIMCLRCGREPTITVVAQLPEVVYDRHPHSLDCQFPGCCPKGPNAVVLTCKWCLHTSKIFMED